MKPITSLVILSLFSLVACAPLAQKPGDATELAEKPEDKHADVFFYSWGEQPPQKRDDRHADIFFYDWSEPAQKRDDKHTDIFFYDWSEANKEENH